MSMIKDKKMNEKKNIITIGLLFFCMLIISSCTRSDVEEPSPLGPSTISLVFEVTANPNILTAGSSRQSSMITASLKKYDGTPYAGKTVLFDIRNAQGQKIYEGFFVKDDQYTASRVTDSQGIATVKYYGPNAKEISSEMEIYIYALVPWQGQEFLISRAPIYIILSN
jgi:hypothetical protein